MGKFGDKFRKERERRDIKLEDVSNSTKIGSRMLRAIEEERFDQLPGGVFNKGFIRAYAKYLGLDEEETITGYVAALNLFNSQQWDAEKPAPQPSATERSPAQPSSGQSGSGQGSSGQSNSGQSDSAQPGPGKFISSEPAERQPIGEQRNDPRRRSTDSQPSDPQNIELPDLQLPNTEHVRPRRRMAVDSDPDGSRWRLPALVVLLIVAGAFWWSHSRNARANSASPASANPAPARPAPVSSGPASLSPSSAKAASISPASASAGRNDGAKTATTSSHISSPVTPAGKAGAHPGSPTASSQAPATANAAHASVAKEAAQPEAEAFAAPRAPKPVANLTLVIRASETSWIAVTADGQPVVHETLIAPAHTSVRASREIVVRAGNAAGITFALNGQEFPSQGAEGEVKTLIFDSTGLRLGATPAVPPVPTTPAADPTH